VPEITALAKNIRVFGKFNWPKVYEVENLNNANEAFITGVMIAVAQS
jgi:hypothetical protein